MMSHDLAFNVELAQTIQNVQIIFYRDKKS